MIYCGEKWNSRTVLNGRKARAYQIRPGLQCREVELHTPKIVQTENGDEPKRQMREKVYLFPNFRT